MTKQEFNQLVTDYGKDILRFCRMTTGSIIEGDELYQDTMLTLWEQRDKLEPQLNIKSYALSVSILIWKNRKRRFAWRSRLAPCFSYDEKIEQGTMPELSEDDSKNPENRILRKEVIQTVRTAVWHLPEKYRMVIYLYYSADMKIREIAECLKISENTVKTRLRKAKSILREKLEVVEQDG